NEARQQCGKPLKNPRKNKMAEGGHVVSRKSQGMIQAAKGELKILPPFLFQMSKGMKTALAVFAVTGDRKVKLAGRLPERVVLGLVKVLAPGKKGIDDG